jgi:hypothetical protein
VATTLPARDALPLKSPDAGRSTACLRPLGWALRGVRTAGPGDTAPALRRWLSGRHRTRAFGTQVPCRSHDFTPFPAAALPE